MKNLTPEQLAVSCGGIRKGAWTEHMPEVTSVSTDSRKVEAGSLFVPIRGEHADGHDYIPQVIQAGAACTLSEKDLGDVDFPYIQVESSLQAVKDIAAFYLEGLGIPVVGITGSVGKTSTKEMIASVLSERYRVLKTQGNFNNELGLPLTIFRLRAGDEVAVLEMGISDFGEMSHLAAIARPDIMVITNIGPCHLEFLHDRDGVLQAKTECFSYMKEGGHIILNGDDDKLRTVEKTRGMSPVFYGLSDAFPYYAEGICPEGLAGTSCCLHMPEGKIDVRIAIPGEHMVYNALAAAAVGRQMQLSPEEIRHGIENCRTLAGRNHVVERNGITILDDCYNANPISMRSSLDVLSHAPGRTVAVLGDMGELGEDERALHYEVGVYAAQKRVDLLLAAGPLSAELCRGAVDSGGTEVYHYTDREKLLEDLPQQVKRGDTILVKASHFMGFSAVVDALQQGG